MNALFKIMLMVVFLFGVVGCDDDSPPDDYYSSSYSYDGYASVFVDNQSAYDVGVIVGNSLYERLGSGDATYVSRNLVGNQALWISIDFLDGYGNIFARTESEDFYRRDRQQNLVIYGPGDVRAYK